MKKNYKVFFSVLILQMLMIEAVVAQELTLRMLIWEGYAPLEARQAFQLMVKNEYGVNLKFEIYHASNPDEFFNKLRKEEVDLISPAHNVPKDYRYNLIQNGLTIPLNIENIPNYKKLMPTLINQPWFTDQGKVYAVPVVHGVYGLAYNSKMVKNPPKSWSIFWNPDYMGQYTINQNYYELNLYITALALGSSQNDIFEYDKIKGEKLEYMLSQLAVNARELWSGFDQPEHYKNMSLASTWRFTFPEENEHFVDWKVAEPEEGTLWFIDTMMLGRSLKNQDLLRTLAEQWINFLLEPENQVYHLAKKIGVCPVTDEAWELYSTQVLSDGEREKLERLFKHLIPWRILETRSRNAFHLLWQEALAERSASDQAQGTGTGNDSE